MKAKYSFFILLFSINFLVAYSQIPYYFENSPKWCSSSFENEEDCNIETNFVYYIEGEISLNDTIYEILNKRGVLVGYGSCPVYSEFDIEYAYLRQEGEKIFMWDGDNSALLYDFSLVIGDTIPNFEEEDIFSIFPPNCIITSVDSVIVNDAYYKRLFFSLPDETINPLGEDYYIEGIGHYMGFVNEYAIAYGAGTNTYSYARNDTIYFTFPENGSNCDFSVDINESPSLTGNVEIYPVPVENYLNIKLSNGNLINHWIIYSLTGQRKMERRIHPSELLRIDLSSLESGIYLIEIRNSGFSNTLKFVKE